MEINPQKPLHDTRKEVLRRRILNTNSYTILPKSRFRNYANSFAYYYHLTRCRESQVSLVVKTRYPGPALIILSVESPLPAAWTKTKQNTLRQTKDLKQSKHVLALFALDCIYGFPLL